jgi:iron complex outermembrane receptor protein
VSGVNYAASSGNRSEQFVIRGFVAENGIFRNGFRDDFFSIRAVTELANIDRVEILKGPASILFGRSDPAGIINYVTKKPLRKPFYEVGFTAGSFDFYRPTLDFSGPLTENGNLAYRLNAAYENAGSFRDGVERERFFVAPTLSWEISDDTDLTLEFSYLNVTQPVDDGLVVLSDNEVADIPFSTFLGDPSIRQDVEESRTELYFDHRFNDNLSLRSLLRYTTATETGSGVTSRINDESEDDRNFPVEEGSDAKGFFETFTIQNDLTSKFNTGSLEHTVLFGVEYFTGFQDFIAESRPSGTIDIFNPSAFEPATDEPFELQFEGEFTTDSFGIFLQDQIAILDNLQFVIGGRFDTVEVETVFDGEENEEEGSEAEGDAFTPRLGIVYQPIEPVSLYASFSTSFFPADGMDISGEPFDPTKGKAFEIGVKGEIIKNKLFSTLAFYDTTLTNVTTEDPDDPNFSIQTGEQNSRGIELDIQGEILPGWNIFTGYTYTDAEVTEDNVIPVGNRLTNVPENNFNLWTTYTLQKGSLAGLGFGAGVFYIGERAGDIDNSFFVDGYTRVDAAIYYEKENYRAAVNFKNLFNADFIEGTGGRLTLEPGAPFAVQGTVSAKF